MSKQQGNAAPAGGTAGWLNSRGQAQASVLGLPALSPLRAAYARYKMFWRQWQRAVARPGKAVSVDEITRGDARVPLFNFTGTPGVFQWWPGESRHF